MIVCEHEFDAADPPKCKHCGGTNAAAMCVSRQKERGPFVSAMEDIDTINARLRELRAEAAAALTRGRQA